MQKAKLWIMVIAVGLLLAFPLACTSGEKAPRQDKETVKSWLSDPQVVIFDVRAPQDWNDSKNKIKGAVRQDPKGAKTWSATLPKDKKIVLYCA
jgi:hypothetical protein